ncbi:hypothetical protein ES702_07856 [subsurface metagenome]
MEKTMESPLQGRLKRKESTGERARIRIFFKTLFKEVQGYVEIRTIKEGRVKQYFYSDLERLTKDLTGNLPEFKNTNVYFGVCPRDERKGKEENVKEVGCIWIDLDCHNDKERVEKLKGLKKFNLRPSIIVSSGRGYHIYWLLDKAFTIKNQEERLTIKGYVKGLSKALGGDHTFDLARVLRVPGTMNLKDPDKPLPVKLSEFYPDHSFKLEDFEPYRVEVEEIIQGDVTPGEIPDKFWVLVKANSKIKATWDGKREDLKDKTRSGYDMALANLLVAHGFTDNETASVLRRSTTGRGKDATLHYLNRTIGEARRVWDKRKEEPMKDEKFDWTKEKWINDKMKDIAREVFTTEKGATKKKREIKKETKTLIPGLIHLIKDDDVVKYLLKDGKGLKIVGEYKTDKGIYTPYQDLPMEYPNKDVLDLSISQDWQKLLDEVIRFIKSYVEMPSENDYLYLALWVFHTYLIEKFGVTPLLYFYGVHVTGKTRAGEVLSKIGFRVERLTAPTEATLFRSASYFKNALVIDEIKLWGRDANENVANLIKSRYKRGLKVSRINQNVTGEKQVEYFDVFAPLVICTTEPLPDIIESRCLMFTMRANVNADVEKCFNEAWAQDLRNKLTMFRTCYLETEFDELPRVARRRLNEILTPLYRVLMLIDPGREDEFKSTVKEIERQKQEEAGMSLEAEIIEVVAEYQKKERRDFVLTGDVADIMNETRKDKDKISNMLVSNRLKKLGFHKERERSTGKMGFRIDSELLEKLQIQYGIEEWTLSPEDQKEPEFEYSQEKKDEPHTW